MSTSPQQKRWLILPIEVQVRELMGKLVVSSLAAQRDYDVLIGHDQVVRRLAAHLPRGILFDKALGRKGDRKIARYHRLGYKITAFDEESTGFYANPQVHLQRRMSVDAFQKAERFFCLSEKVRQTISQNYPGFDEKLVVSGIPRSDAFREQFRAFYQPQIDEIRQKHGRYILFASNFGIIIHGMSDGFLNNQKKRDSQDQQDVSAYLTKMEQQMRQNLVAFEEMLPRLMERFSDHKLVIRPHPSERNSYWHEKLGHIPNVVITDEGTAAPWILASECLVHHGCTTGIEAGLMKKPHVMYAPYPDEHHDTEIMKAFAPRVYTEGELFKLVDRIINKGEKPKMDIAAISEWYANLEGPLVSETIVDEFDKIEIEPATLSPRLHWLKAHPRHLVAKYRPRSAREEAYRNKKYPGTSLEEVSRIVSIAGQQLGASLKVEEVFPQLYHIHKA